MINQQEKKNQCIYIDNVKIFLYYRQITHHI